MSPGLIRCDHFQHHQKVAATVQTECLPTSVTQSKYFLENTSLIKLDIINVPPIWKTLAQLLADEINSRTHPTHLQVERVVVKTINLFKTCYILYLLLKKLLNVFN